MVASGVAVQLACERCLAATMWRNGDNPACVLRLLLTGKEV
jgi:hypothetical protein